MGTKRFAYLAVGLVAAGALLTGCSTVNPERDEVDRQYAEQNPTAGKKAGTWFGDRWYDLTDIIKADLAFGMGIGVNIHATEILQAGIGTWDGTSVGLRARSFGKWEESKTHRGLGPWYWVDVERTPIWGTSQISMHEYQYTGWDIMEETGDKAIDHDWSELGASVQIIAIGAHVAGSPLEAVDFLAGLIPISLIENLFGGTMPAWDIMDDDAYARLAAELEEEQGLGE
jgi:hypothetical protein